MKTNKLIVPLLTGVLFAAAANTRADIDLTITGSTAFRSIAVNRIGSLLDVSNFVGNASDAAFGGCFYGTMSNAVPSLGSTVVQVHTTFSGSAQGAIDVLQHNLIGATMKDGSHTNLAPDLAFTDNWPEAQIPPFKSSQFDADQKMGVNVFSFIANVNLYNTGLTNITRETAKYLMTSSGDKAVGGAGMPGTYLGSSLTNCVYLLGRDIGSGTRITTFANIGFTGTPVQWAVNSSGNYVLASSIAGQAFSASGGILTATLASTTFVKTNLSLGDPANGYALDGFDSGGTLTKVVDAAPNAIGYAGYPDATGNGSNHKLLTFQGVTPTPANVESGAYPFWSYEHLFSVGSVGGDANKAAIKAALVSATTNSTFQNTSIYSATVARLGSMQVKRLVDGGPISTVSGSSYGF